jgi:hypothetical protein
VGTSADSAQQLHHDRAPSRRPIGVSAKVNGW